MKVAVTAQEPQTKSRIDTRFGRAKWVVIVDTNTGEVQVRDNKVNLNAIQGAGIQTGQNISNLHVDAVITGNMGPNAYKVLNAAGVKIYLASNETVERAVIALKTGKLQQIKKANVDGHWI